MAAAQVVYEGIHRNSTQGDTLFRGQKFWFSATVPQRQWLAQNVEANGGIVVKLETQADVLLVDHTRKTAPPHSHSYRYVELSIRKGRLEDLHDHVVGESSRSNRAVGSVSMAPKGGRTPFTAEDDQLLWNWVKPFEDEGGATGGNTIYQQLEALNPRHTYQSWRDRWIKRVKHEKREITERFDEDNEDARLTRLKLANTEEAREVSPAESRTRRISSARKSPSTNHSFRNKPECQAGTRRIIERLHGDDEEVQPVKQVLKKWEKATGSAPTESRPPSTLSSHKQPSTDQILSPNPERLVAKLVVTNGRQRDVDEMQLARPESIERESPRESTVAESRTLNIALHHKAPSTDSRLTTNPEQVIETEWTFSELERLLMAAEHIIDCHPAKVDKAWQGMAQQNSAHTAAEWKACFELKVRPIYQRQLEAQLRKKEQKQLRENNDWLRHNLEPRRKPIPGYADKGIQTLPLRSPTSSRTDQPPQSPSFDPQSPLLSEADVSAQDKPSEPHEARKRRAGKGTNSQESNTTEAQGLESVDDLQSMQQFSLHGKRHYDSLDLSSPSLPFPSTTKRQKRKTFKLKDEPIILEIPSTPERLRVQDDAETGEDEPESPTPRAKISKSRTDDASGVPVLSVFSQFSDGGAFSTPKPTVEAEQVALTSPLSIRLVSERDSLDKSSSFIQPREEVEEENDSPTPEFETAPDFSQTWETAVENQPTAKPGTQALFNAIACETFNENEFNLPDPEGGWVDLLSSPSKNKSADAVNSKDGDDRASSASSLDLWIDAQLAKDSDVDEELLLCAAQTTNLDFRLAERVYEGLVRGKGVPANLRGVWTSDDDRILQGADAREIKRIEEKHGSKGVRERLECLENWR